LFSKKSKKKVFTEAERENTDVTKKLFNAEERNKQVDILREATEQRIDESDKNF
jgi:hypothetical protein